MDHKDSSLYKFASKIIKNKWFNYSIIGLIILNGILIGVQTSPNAPEGIQLAQLFILFIFFVEILFRWWGRESSKAYWADLWNWFDIIIVVLGLIPEIAELLYQDTDDDSKNGILSTFRVLRVLQLTRSFRAVQELQFLIKVLVRSIRSLSYIAVLFMLIMYMYAIVGVTLFKNHNYKNSENLHLTTSNPDPYENLGEASFTLFRVITGEDWTDLCYNLQDNDYTRESHHENNLAVNNTVITIYHVSWFVIASYMLINLVIGTVINNFQVVLYEKEKKEKKERHARKRAEAEARKKEEEEKALEEEKKEDKDNSNPEA